MNYWLNQGADRKKLIMGMPMYGQSFSLADNNENGLNAPTYGGGEAGDGTRARGFLSYYEVPIMRTGSKENLYSCSTLSIVFKNCLFL